MKTFNRFAIAALLAGGAIIVATAPANAHVDVSISVGGSVFAGDYDYDRPCAWYRYWNLPAPGRCYRAYWGFYGPNVYIVDGFVFRDRDDWDRWHDRDEWLHWRVHQFRRADWHDHGWHGRDHDRDDADDDDDQGEDHDRD